MVQIQLSEQCEAAWIAAAIEGKAFDNEDDASAYLAKVKAEVESAINEDQCLAGLSWKLEQVASVIPNVNPPQWGPLENVEIEPGVNLPAYAEPALDLSESCIADSRAFYNAIEKMRLSGLGATANALAELGRDPAIKARLIAIADEGGYPGGLLCAEEAAEQVHEEIQSLLTKMG